MQFFSDAGCPLSSNYKEISKHLPIPSSEFQPTIYYRNGKQLNENDEQFLHLESQIKSREKKKTPKENENDFKNERSKDEESVKSEKVVQKRDKIQSHKKEETSVKRQTEGKNIGKKYIFFQQLLSKPSQTKVTL